MINTSIRFIECQGSPSDMGFQYGRSARDAIALALSDSGSSRIQKSIACNKKIVEKIKHSLMERLPDVYAEMQGLADGAEQKFETIMLLNHYHPSDMIADSCTPIGLRSETDGVLIAKNNDGAPGEKAKHPFVVRKSVPAPGCGLPMIQITYAGWLSGLDAMNSAGVANTHGSVGSSLTRCAWDIDIRLAAYQAMRQAENAADFTSSLKKYSLTGKGFNILVGDAAGKTLIIEAAVPLLVEKDHGKKFLYSTNHYLCESIKNSDGRTARGKEISVYRLGYLKWVEVVKPPQNMNDMKNLLAAHEPWAPCRHAGPHVSVTEWSMICLTREKKILLADNNPCDNEYQEVCL